MNVVSRVHEFYLMWRGKIAPSTRTYAESCGLSIRLQKTFFFSFLFLVRPVCVYKIYRIFFLVRKYIGTNYTCIQCQMTLHQIIVKEVRSGGFIKRWGVKDMSHAQELLGWRQCIHFSCSLYLFFIGGEIIWWAFFFWEITFISLFLIIFRNKSLTIPMYLIVENKLLFSNNVMITYLTLTIIIVVVALFNQCMKCPPILMLSLIIMFNFLS